MPFGETDLQMPRLPRERPEPQKALRQHVVDALKKIGAAEEHREKSLATLVQYHRRERARILGGAAKKLKAFRAKQQESRAKYGVWHPQQKRARKLESIRYAQELGVNTDELFRLNAYVRGRARLILDATVTKTFHTTGFQPLS